MAMLSTLLASRYSIENELGRGGMATVYLALDQKHGRKVAVKVLAPEIASAMGPERFHREIQIAAGLTHPHILPSLIRGGRRRALLRHPAYLRRIAAERLAAEGRSPARCHSDWA
jgi:serine/threonine-protein kinase